MPKNYRQGKAAILTDGDYLKIKSFLISPHHKLIADICWWTGERMGAVCQLPTNAVYDIKGKPLSHITFGARTRKASPDGKRQTRQVPTHPTLREILRAYGDICKPDFNGFLFPGKTGERPLQFQSVDECIRRAIAKANLGSNGISMHSFRRTFITKLASRGVAIPVIQKITGHQDLKALQRYIEVSEEQIEGAISTL